MEGAGGGALNNGWAPTITYYGETGNGFKLDCVPRIRK